jgi:hypothetical protein
VNVEIDPEPPEPVRKAIVAALAADEQVAQESLWWRVGVDEAVADERG